MSNSIREAIEAKDILFQQLFTRFQSDIRKNPNYINFDAFKDLKIIFELYSETFHLKGFNYNNLNKSNIEKLLEGFNSFQKKELVHYLIKSLSKNGIDEKAKELFSLLSKLEIICSWTEIKQNKNSLKNSLKLMHNLTVYNNYTLLISPLVYILFTIIIYSKAPFKWMEVLEVKKIEISDIPFWNHFSNILFYIFDFDGKMTIIPLNLCGLCLMVFLKSFLIIIVINFFLKELFNRIKLS
jgi:hypothetical protein